MLSSIQLFVVFVAFSSAKEYGGIPAYVPPVPYPGECVICDPNPELKIIPNTITFVYKSIGASSTWQPSDKASCEADIYPLTTTLTVMNKNGVEFETIIVSEGDMFVIGHGYHLPDETHFAISAYGECFIHTSCTVPLVPGDQIGPFLVYGGNNCTHVPRECIVPDKTSYACGETISLSWDLALSENRIGSLNTASADDWIGIYPCDADPDSLPNVWQRTLCDHEIVGKQLCDYPATGSGIVLFSTLSANSEAEPHVWSIQSTSSTCFKAIYASSIGPSVSPYVTRCASARFDIACPTAYKLASQL